ERSRLLFHEDPQTFPVYGTIASQFNDEVTNALFAAIMDKVNEQYDWDADISFSRNVVSEERKTIIPNDRIHYLREISSTIRSYHDRVKKQSDIARKLYQLQGTKRLIEDETIKTKIDETIEAYEVKLSNEAEQLLSSWDDTKELNDGVTFTILVCD